MQVRLIVIGAFDYTNHNNTRDNITIDFINNFKKWNNPSQAKHSNIVNLICDILCDHPDMSGVDCICIDPMYKFDTLDEDSNIKYVVDHFVFGETKYLLQNGHNIIIEFANILDEYFVTKPPSNHRQQYKGYKLTWISCGCAWNHNLPNQLIRTVIENQLYTPTDCYDKQSLIYASTINKIYYEDHLLQPYFQGLYQMLGSFMWRGCKDDNYHYENVVYEFIEEILKTDTFEESVQNDIIKFMLHEAHWNELDRKTRKTINEYVYGTLVTIS